MRRGWPLMLRGLLIWAVHFSGVYLLASLADISPASPHLWAGVMLWLTGVCVGLGLWSLGAALRSRDPSSSLEQLNGFAAEISALGSGLAIIAMLFQSLPVILL